MKISSIARPLREGELPYRVAAATTIAVGDEGRGAHGSADADGPRSGHTTSVPFSDRAPSCSTATRSMPMPMIRGLKPTAIIVAAATRQSCPFLNHPAGPLALPSMATAFGVRGLDPALTFGGSSAVRKTMVKRMATNAQPAFDASLPLNAIRDESKSGIKPPHSKASRHSHAAFANQQPSWRVAPATTVAVGEERTHGPRPFANEPRSGATTASTQIQ